ncbi:unnamed protein product [Ectocarpus sp. 4 AP-2014]
MRHLRNDSSASRLMAAKPDTRGSACCWIYNHFSWTYLVQRYGHPVLDTNPSVGAWWNGVDGQGTHGDENLVEVDALLPGATFVEKEGIYVNTEGRPQRSAFVFPPPGIARQDWKIVRALGEFVGVTLPYSEDEEMEERVQTLVPLTLNMDELSHSQVGPIPGPPKGEIRVHETTLGPLVHDFYRTDAVSRASVTMAKTSALHRETASTWEY